MYNLSDKQHGLLIEGAETGAAFARGKTPPAMMRRWFSLVPLAENLNLWKPTIAAVNGFAVAGGF